MAEPVEVVIMGQVFSVTSEDGEEHIRRVASDVDGKMREIASSGKVISSFTAAVLTALNIASECQKLRQSAAETKVAIERLTERIDAVGGEAASGGQRRVVRNG